MVNVQQDDYKANMANIKGLYNDMCLKAEREVQISTGENCEFISAFFFFGLFVCS